MVDPDSDKAGRGAGCGWQEGKREFVMALTWRQKRRFVRDTLRFLLSPSIKAADVQNTLNMLAPFKTDIPLIRIGGSGNGGYLLPDDLDGIVACFSPGVGATMTFDEEIMDRGIPCYMVDGSVEKLPASNVNATFEKLFLGPETSAGFISLDDWVARHSPPEGDLLLQMDIEGAEYEILNATKLETLARFRIIALESHDVQRITRATSHTSMSRAFKKLDELFVLAHAHPNNNSPVAHIASWEIPPLLELTYIRRDRVETFERATDLPHPLDEANVADKPDLPLPHYWQ